MVSTRLRLALVALVGMCTGQLIGFASAHGATICTDPSVTICRLWVSSSGSDSNSGLSADRPLRTLQRANDLLCQTRCSGIGKNVKVILASGTYPNATTVWSYSDRTYATQIVGQDVVMDGRHSTDWGLYIAPKNSRSNIQVFYIKWTRYLRGGVIIGGGGHNRIYRNTFYRLGSYYSKKPETPAYAGIYLFDNRDTSIERSVFVDILNSGSGYGLEHGVYITHSSYNRVTGSGFSNVGGDPIRLRDAANYNTISGNAFTNTGRKAYISDWRCVSSATKTCPGPDESLSWHNSFRDNVLRSPHPWHSSGFTARYCYDLPGPCPSLRIAG
ncbi:MAG TPA: right-handed parallel beta-helix repeat-containing protein [Aeromicrobium sp.]|nr:right-handed parallel beta-helix repeat-containing protein [Aeromicrobium sp.]